MQDENQSLKVREVELLRNLEMSNQAHENQLSSVGQVQQERMKTLKQTQERLDTSEADNMNMYVQVQDLE